MKLKLDENFGHKAAAALVEAGHDVHTVLQEELGGAPDTTIFETCVREQRCVVTLDLDFADVVRFPPHRSAGIAVLRSAKSNSPDIQRLLIQNLASALEADQIEGRLWIVEATRVRVHANTDPNADF